MKILKLVVFLMLASAAVAQDHPPGQILKLESNELESPTVISDGASLQLRFLIRLKNLSGSPVEVSRVPALRSADTHVHDLAHAGEIDFNGLCSQKGDFGKLLPPGEEEAVQGQVEVVLPPGGRPFFIQSVSGCLQIMTPDRQIHRVRFIYHVSIGSTPQSVNGKASYPVQYAHLMDWDWKQQ